MQSAQRVIHDNSTNLQKTQKLLIQIQNCDEKTMVGQNFKLQIVRRWGLIEFPRIELHANERPKTLAPQPPKISRTTVIRSFFVKNAAKKLHTSAPKNSKSVDFGSLQIIITFSYFFNKKLQNDIKISDLLYVF